MSKDYQGTLQLPKTDFPMRANLPEREPRIIETWNQLDIYRLVRERCAGRPRYVLHDGPPYSNGDIHIGTAQNKILKDMVVKYKTLRGYDCPYVPGFDTHGLPLEHRVMTETGLDRGQMDPVEWRGRCRDFALQYVDKQTEQFRRMGVRGDWENRYVTLDPEYEARQLQVFGEIALGGMIYRGFRPVYWSVLSRTALADAEIEYHDIESPAITVRFPWADDLQALGSGLSESDQISVPIWTTTPWTLPGNMAVCLHPTEKYVLVFAKGDVAGCPEQGEYLLIGEGRFEALREELGYEVFDIVGRFRGEELEGRNTRHPFLDRESPIILGTHVTMEDGTGCVHTAPGHGEEDFIVGRQYGLPIISPMGDDGCLTDEAGQFAGLHWEKANEDIPAWLKENGFLIKLDALRHPYPHCWRGKDPVLFRCTEQWFIDMEKLRQPALQALDRVTWVPAEGQQRIAGMMESRPDWCISRQRVWGVPIPIFFCGGCGEIVYSQETFDSVVEKVRQGGSDAWFALPAEELLPDSFKCPACDRGADQLRKEMDIMDVWFDSGTSWAGVLERSDELGFPSDLYIEGSDQHRGWFQSSLLTSMATRQVPPYKTCVTHGFVVDEMGRKMSKSIGNVIDPLEVASSRGADIIRLWVATVDFKRDLHCSAELFDQVSKTYRSIRNTCRFLLGNLSDFDPEADAVPYADMLPLDQWALGKLGRLIESATRRMEEWDFHHAVQEIHGFCETELSTLYMDMTKDRLYASADDWRARRSAQTAMDHILRSLTLMLAPVLTFTCEEIWEHRFKTDELPTVQLGEWPSVRSEWMNEDLLERFEVLETLRAEAYRAIEKARSEKLFKKPLDGRITIHAPQQVVEVARGIEEQGTPLAEFLILSGSEVHEGRAGGDVTLSTDELGGVDFLVEQAEGEKCPRCWHVETSVGQSDEHPELCARCVRAVTGAPEE
ncbi:MAG: isoleucine--tRNA ligase [Armatimonadia bacterium]|nr:isoleucine--tRNA ligase [Armatimonadia bacterium]